MTSAARAVAASALVVLAAAAAFWSGTDGFRAFTTETARRIDVRRSPRVLPEIALEDHDGRQFTLAGYRGRTVLVDFIYTRCPSLCRSLGTAFQQIEAHLEREGLGGTVALLSISFDVDRDDVPSLAQYARTYHADGVHWRIARVSRRSDAKALLDAFGVVAVPDGFGGYEHNAAIHVLDARGRLAEIVDMEDALPYARRLGGAR